MASTHCFYLHHHGLSAPARPSSSQRYVPVLKPNQLVCRAQKQSASAHEDDGASSVAVSRRLALTVLIGAAAVGSKVSPADAAYGEAGTCFSSFVNCLSRFQISITVLCLVMILIVVYDLIERVKMCAGIVNRIC